MTFTTSRVIPAEARDVFAAFADGHRLAAWWGPLGFTNTFEEFEFSAGGRWLFVMHGPDGKNYPNESRFLHIEELTKVVVEHLSQPKFELVVTLEPSGAVGTKVTWAQTFEDPETARRVESIVVPSNEQNLDRWTAEVLRLTPSV